MKLSRHITHQFHHLIHHFAVALVLASAVLILEHHGMLNWLDSLSLRTVGTLHTIDADPNKLNPKDAPISLLIGDDYFEGAFRQESPLDRRELTRLIGRILQERPAVLAIDLDLSPGPVGSPGNAGQNELDALLIHFARSEKQPIVLTIPFPVASNELFTVKHTWLLKMCNAGISLAYPHIVLSQGLVMRYAFRQPSLGIVASGSSGNVSTNLCQNVLAGPDKSLFLSKAFAIESALTVDDLRAQRPISADYLRHASALQRVIQWKGLESTVKGLRDRPVFLGSQFDSRDEFLTPFGPLKGTVVHAATFFSERRPTYAVTHGVAVLLDLIFGVIAGFLFGAVWKKTNAEAAVLDAGGASFRNWFVARGWLMAAFGLLLLWLTMLFYASAWLLTHDLWNNPGPMIGGVFVKTLLASRIGLRDSAHHGESGSVGAKKAFLLRNLDWVVMSPLVIWAGILLFGH